MIFFLLSLYFCVFSFSISAFCASLMKKYGKNNSSASFNFQIRYERVQFYLLKLRRTFICNVMGIAVQICLHKSGCKKWQLIFSSWPKVFILSMKIALITHGTDFERISKSFIFSPVISSFSSQPLLLRCRSSFGSVTFTTILRQTIFFLKEKNGYFRLVNGTKRSHCCHCLHNNFFFTYFLFESKNVATYLTALSEWTLSSFPDIIFGNTWRYVTSK